jgi:hypothetical protein
MKEGGRKEKEDGRQESGVRDEHTYAEVRRRKKEEGRRKKEREMRSEKLV